MENNAKKRNLWKENDIIEMLISIKKKHKKLLDKKTFRNKAIYEEVAMDLKERNIHKSAVQIRAKFKSLKGEYFKVKRSNNTSGTFRHTCDYYDLLDEMLSHRPALTAVDQDTTMEETANLNVEETMELNVPDNNSGIEDEPTSNVDKQIVYKNPKRETYQKVVESFTKEWKDTQERILEGMKEQDKEYLNGFNELLETNRKETAKMLEIDRQETAKMLSNFLQSLQPQQQQQFCSITDQLILPNKIEYSPSASNHDQRKN